MTTGWRYRTLAVVGVAALTALAVLVANHAVPQYLFTTYVPVFNRLDVTVLEGRDLRRALSMAVFFTIAALVPMYKPRPRRILDAVFLTQKRVMVSGLALATLGYFQWSHRLPRATLVMLTAMLVFVLPAWFVAIRRPVNGTMERTIIVGDDLAQMRSVRDAVEGQLLGFLCPTGALPVADPHQIIADGGDVTGLEDLDHLGGLSRVEDVLVEYDVDTVVLAFGEADRGEFFGALDACYEHGVAAKVHRDYTDSVLTPDSSVGPLVDVEVEPWDWQDYAFKRVFDVCFAAVGLLAWLPAMLVIAVAIKLDSRGPVLYKQERTAVLGETFPVYKFRTMVPEGESAEPVEDEENNRVTRVGRVLRKTHLDEIPQLWTILTGRMSVVGPRAVWTDEEALLEESSRMWRKRWFVKPGLTGLAQINGAKSTDPEAKLKWDIQYIRRQTFWFDLKIVIRQVWLILIQATGAVASERYS
ncbi:sugar transferase [Halostella sp. JP-L12]|uniref:sugar transferase n=1 Tax=Halostella TaxID=1843185 RepID=UPI000EF78ECC|nr:MULTISPECIES: sugar transferase [Halostella]NHN46227.1 sugar transferase [Halostella sp. JP-L12]